MDPNLWVGVDPNPNPNPNQVLALWVGVDVPHDAQPDLYHGVLLLRDLSTAAAAAEMVKVELQVGEEAIEQHGDSLYLHTSPHITPHLPTSPCISPHLARRPAAQGRRPQRGADRRAPPRQVEGGWLSPPRS